MITPEDIVGTKLEGPSYAWTDDDVILYHLGVGAGFDPVDTAELRYVYEGDLHVLPTFASIPPFATMMGFFTLDGLEVYLAQVLLGEQESILHGPIPTSGMVTNQGSVTHVYDKGKGALVVIEVISYLEGMPLFTNRSSIYVRGEGGFGGDPGPSTSTVKPERQPDVVIESPTMPQQALLYRLSSGDRNPLHADPGFAAFAGYERPILHGLCTYGIVAKAAVDHALDGDPTRVASFSSRFSGVMFPGETVITNVWDEEGVLLISATTRERGLPVISNARMTLV